MTESIKDFVRSFRVRLIQTRAGVLPSLALSGRVVILAPHPDDEVIGCGGLIQRLVSQDNPPHVVILTGGGKSHAGCCGIEEDLLTAERRSAARRILSQLGLLQSHLHLLDFPDGGISPTHPEMEQLKALVSEIKPDSIFIPHHGEGWPDHLACRELVEAIPALNTSSLYEYCVWFWYYNVWNLEWKNASVLRMSPEEHAAKCQAVDAYTTALAPCGKPWAGVLPELLVKAGKWNKELYFKVR